MTSVANILENLSPEEALDKSKLEKVLKLTKKIDKDNLTIALNALIKLEIIKDIDCDKFVVNNETLFIQGRVRCSSKGYCFVVREDEGEDIYIREPNLNHAWHGDYVIVKITKEGLRRRAPEGEIQCILKRYNESLLANLEFDKSNGLLKAIPLDDRITSYIDIKFEKKNQHFKLNEGVIYEIKIDKYPIAQLNANGSIIRELPLNAGLDGDIEILLSKNNILKNQVVPKIAPKRIVSNKREDFTNQPSLIFSSWESKNSPSLPALYVEPFEGGSRIWVHCPTVAERIIQGGKLDEYLKVKGESICLGNNWLEFLPQSLKASSEFRVNEQNDALTLVIDLNNKGVVLDWKFSLSIIKPVHKITNTQLQSIKKRKITSKSIPIALKSIKESLEDIQSIIHCAKIINKTHNGSVKLDLDIPNLERLNEFRKTFPSRDFHGWKKSFDIEDPQSIIDLFIRLSNNILAKHLIGFQLPFIYKEHEGIDQSSINELSKSALALDKKITLNNEGSITTNELLETFESSSEKMILHKLIKHLIPGIHLKNSDEYYNKINDIDNYTSIKEKIEVSWCCPTINYWNIYNQFIISTLLNDGKYRQNSRSKITVDLGRKDSWNDVKWELFSPKVNDLINNSKTLKLIQNLNDTRKKTKSLRNNLISMAQGREAQKIIGKEVKATITGVQSYGFFAEIEELTAEGLVHVSTLGDDWYEYRSRQNLLVGRKNKKTYQLAQKVNVRVLKVDILKNQIDLELVKINIKETENLVNNEETKSNNI